MPVVVVAETSSSSSSSSSPSTTIAEHIKLRRPRNQTFTSDPPLSQTTTTTHLHPSRCKPTSSTISSLFNSNDTTTTQKKKPTTTFPQTSSFMGLGCTASSSQQVSVPAVIRSSADWETKKEEEEKKKKKNKNKKKKKKKMVENQSKKGGSGNGGGANESRGIDTGGCVAIPDVWCGPGIGFSTDAVVGASVEPPVLSSARRNVQGRRKVDGEKMTGNQRESSSFCDRRAVNPETLAFLESDSALLSTRHEPPLFSSRYHRQLRHPPPDGFAEIMMLQNGFLMGGRLLDPLDHFHDLRLDVDSMTYEQLLELGDRIGYVSTGLKEDEINRCLRRTKPALLNNSPLSHLTSLALADKNCSICQDEYEEEDETGKLKCGHSFHIQCIKQWLKQKNACPVCKTAAAARP